MLFFPHFLCKKLGKLIVFRLEFFFPISFLENGEISPPEKSLLGHRF
jgi:hypothetical protein